MGAFLIFVIFIAVFVLVAGLYVFLPLFYALAKKKNGRRYFFSLAKEAGFNRQDAESLYELALKTDPEDPASLFWFQEKLDLLILWFVRIVERSRGEENKANQEFLSRLYDYRKKIEMDKKEGTNALINTRQILTYQELQILVEGAGSFTVQVLENNDYYMTITRPEAAALDFSWEDRHLSAYFWRNDDAGYLFYSSVLAKVSFQGTGALKINHASTLHRTQKRESVRVKVYKPAYLYIIFNEDDALKLEFFPGLKCILKDLSEDGCAVAIGGRTNRELRVKIQFFLDNYSVCMPGTVRSARYSEETGQSLLHIKADPLPLETRNHILAEVFAQLSYEGQESAAPQFEDKAEETENNKEKDGADQSKFHISAI
jgi:hypothetical protein